VDLQEVRQLDGYLKKLFGNQSIRVVPRPAEPEMADVFVGTDSVGELNVDDEDGDRSYNFRMVIQLGQDAEAVPALNTYLRARFDNQQIRVVPRAKKTDSMEAYLGEEFIGVLFVENEKGRRSYIFELPILDVDLIES
jgi:hypothetical protein